MRVAAPRMSAVLLCQALALLIAGCGGTGGTTTNPAPPSPTPTPTPTPTPPPADTTPPTVPQGLAATVQSSSAIALAWTASNDAGTGVAGYRVFRNASAVPIASVTA